MKPLGGAYYPGATRDPAIAMTPGGTSSGDGQPAVDEPSVQTHRYTNYSVDRHDRRALRGDERPGCPMAETYTLASGLTSRTRTSRVAVNVSLPYGTWTITVKNSVSSVQGN